MIAICDICSLIESHNDFEQVIVTSLLKKGTHVHFKDEVHIVSMHFIEQLPCVFVVWFLDKQHHFKYYANAICIYIVLFKIELYVMFNLKSYN